MTLTLSCNTCGAYLEVSVWAECNADHDSGKPQATPDIRFEDKRSGRTLKWKPGFDNGRPVHQCEACIEDRANNLEPKLKDIAELYEANRATELAAAEMAWKESRKRKSEQ